jgi:hypothetical protein
MGVLRTEGFAALAEKVALEASSYPSFAAAARHAASFGGRIPVEIGLSGLTRPEEHLRSVATEAEALLGPYHESRETVALSRTGRLRLLRVGEDPQGTLFPIGSIQWPGERPDGLDAELDRLAAQDSTEFQGVMSWLAGLDRDQVDAMIGRVRFVLRHIAPVVHYTGTNSYTNLNKGANLVGKSLRPDASACVLHRLSTTPVTEWDPRDGTYLVCLDALIRSGPNVRAEEFNGTQLRPDRMAAFFQERIATYRAVGQEPGPRAGQTDRADQPYQPDQPYRSDELYVLAEESARTRAAALARGAWPYRVVQGLNLNKRELLSETPVSLREVPPVIPEEFALAVGCPTPTTFDELYAACQAVMPQLHQPGPEGFSSRLEHLLHRLVLVATEATQSDVGMSRGPRRVGELIRLIARDSLEPVGWSTNAYFCCVTPSRGFTAQLADAPGELLKAVRAMSARMRYNCWHFLPHGIGMHERSGDRDWFFAPGMPDMTAWSDQHHTGHIATGVRHAIRVSFPVELVGVSRPGLYDFRVMRHAGEAYTIPELRQAIAIGEFMRRIYQAHADLLAGGAPDLDIRDFDNPWYQATYDARAESPVTEQV